MVLATMELMSFVNTPYPLQHAKQLSKKSLHEKNFFIIIIIIGFFINVQVQGQYPHQWPPFQIAGLLHVWQISHQISRCLFMTVKSEMAVC